MMVEMVLESSQDFSMSNGSLPQWKRELLQRRAARPRAAPPSPPPPPAPPAPRPAPDDDEELRYGPGIVKRLKSRYLSLALRDAPRRRPSVLRRAASLEHLLDDRPPAPLPLPPAPRAPRAPLPRPPPPARRRDLVKRARSVDALSRLDARDDPPEPSPPPPPAPPRLPPDAPRAPRPPRRPAPLLREAERPPADVVRAALRKFEPAPRRAVAASLRPALRGLEARGEAEESPRPVSRAALEGIARAGSTTRYSFPAARAGEHLPPLAATNPVLVGRARRVGVIRPMPAPDRTPDCDPASPDPVDKIAPESPSPRVAEEAARPLETTPPPVEHSPRAERHESPPSALVEPTPRPPPDRSPPPVPTSPPPSAPEFILELADLEPCDAKPVPPRPEPRKIEFTKPPSPKPEPVARPRPAPEVMKLIPEVMKSIPEVTKPIPEVTKSILEVTKPIPEVTKTILEVTKPVPVMIEPIPEVTMPTLEVMKPKSVPEVTKFIPVAEVAKPKPEPEVTKSKPVVEVGKPIVVPEVTKAQPVPKVVTNTTPLTNGHSEPARGRSGTVAAADTERAWSGAGVSPGPGGAPWGSPGGARRGGRAPPVATSVVFNFSQRKEVPDYIENDGLILRASRRDRIKAGEPGVVVLRQRQRQRGAGAGSGSGSGSGSDSDSDSVDCSRAPSPLGVRFVNDNVLINGRSSMPARPDRDRQAKLRLQFDDSLTRTFEYPSETSLCLDDTPDCPPSPAPSPRAAEPLPPASAADPRQQLAEPAHLAPLASNTHIVSAALGRYTPHKTAAPSFQLGLRRDDDDLHHDATRCTNGDGDQHTDCGSPALACDVAGAGGCDVTLQQEQEQDLEVEVEGDARPCGADAARSWSDARTLATDLLF